MKLKQVLKAILVGFCFGVGITWLLAVILPLVFGHNPAKFIADCSESISSTSILMGGLSCVIWLIAAATSQKRRKRAELEEALTEYFRSLNEKNKEREEE